MNFRLILVLVFLITLSTEVYTQVYLGIKASYALPFSRSEVLKYDDALDFLTYKMTYVEQDVSPSFSAFMQYRNDIMYLQGEVAYRVIKTRFTSVNYLTPDMLAPKESIKRTAYIRIPVSAGLIVDRFHFGAGPIFGIIVNQNRIFEEIEDFEERRNHMDAGFQFSFGITFYRLQWELSYEYQFNSVADYLYYRKDNKSFKNQAQFLNVGMSFLF